MNHYKIAVIPGDGIGPEVIPEGLQTLHELAEIGGDFKVFIEEFDWGPARYLRKGSMMPADALATLERKNFKALLVGPVGDPRVPDHITLWGLLLPIRQGFEQYIN